MIRVERDEIYFELRSQFMSLLGFIFSLFQILFSFFFSFSPEIAEPFVSSSQAFLLHPQIPLILRITETSSSFFPFFKASIKCIPRQTVLYELKLLLFSALLLLRICNTISPDSSGKFDFRIPQVSSSYLILQ